VIGNLLNIANETTGEDLSPEAREQAINIVASLSGSIVGALGGDVNAAVLAARVEAENNQYSDKIPVRDSSGLIVWVSSAEIANRLPNRYITLGTDLVSLSGVGGRAVGLVSSSIEVWNDPTLINVESGAISFAVPPVGIVIGGVTTVIDITKTAVDVWNTMLFNGITSQMIPDGYGGLIRNPGSMDECDIIGGCFPH